MFILALSFAVCVFGYPLISLAFLFGECRRWWRAPLAFLCWFGFTLLGEFASRGSGVVVDQGSVGYAVFATIVGLWVLGYCVVLMGVFLRDLLFSAGE